MEVVQASRSVITEQRKLGNRVIEYRFHSNGLEENLILQSSPNLTRRQKVVNEIYYTEQSYISQLQIIVDMFLKPIEARSLLPAEVNQAIFGNIEHILSLNKELYTCIRQKGPVDAFINMGPFLKVYAVYADNYNGALEMLNIWEKRSQDFLNFKVATEFLPECQNLKLESLLITPIQRIPRYRLLLQDLLKHTKETHLDYARLKDVCSKMNDMTDYINEHLRAQENSRKILEIQKNLTGSNVPGLLSPGRKFVREGRLMKVCRSSRKAKERMFFLFSDMLVYARPTRSSKTYECRYVLPLLNSSVGLVLGESQGQPGALFRVANEDTSLLLFATKQEEVYSWIESLRKVIQELMESISRQNASRSVNTSKQDPSELSLKLKPRTIHVTPTKQAEDSESLQSNSIHLPSPYPLTSTIINSRSEEDLTGIDRSGSVSSRESGSNEEATQEDGCHSNKQHDRVDQGNSSDSSSGGGGDRGEDHHDNHEHTPLVSKYKRRTKPPDSGSGLVPKLVQDAMSVASGQSNVQVVKSECCSVM